MATCIDFAFHFICNSIDFEGKHKLLGVVVGLACKWHVLNAHFICASLHTCALCHNSKFHIQCFNHRLYVVLLEFDNGIECCYGTVVILSCTSNSFGVSDCFPIGNNIAHISLSAYHLPCISQFTTHNLLQSYTAFLNDTNHLIRINLCLAHRCTNCIQRHCVGTLCERSTCKCGGFRSTKNTLQIGTCIARTCRRMTFIKEQIVILCNGT